MAATTPASESWSSPPRRQHHGGGVSRSKKGREYDRAWYDDEEGGAAHSSYLGVTDESNEKRWAEKEERYRQDQEKNRLTRQPRMSVQSRARNRDGDAWELSRLAQAGFSFRKEMAENVGDLTTDDTGDRQAVVVRNYRPPFLDGRVQFSFQLEPVSVVKDPTADLPTLAKKGSRAMRHLKETQDKTKMRERFWEVAGSKIGEVMGVNNKTIQGEDEDEDETRRPSIEAVMSTTIH
ncbi:hypothetical protein Pmar_PMAR000883 [Perkinsus marinus ATCC 50983]|uniref:Uncharacterized protein n=1 Tax=Perkinsus marinus (strain ATCC 50983 / TXsc) TaxID=423536 RepID=C5KXW8_PERM5|nr:hypothetical protein Pmar_PMAR000883 [Perkinsus marinus ATCC 50983]EER10842.1 hypothetical protein Pmar_PMAR000883 [Perkinsus marinus ATCC 50983]|eukprot:XP_002779047.1 hypothetical protein Pmar_PMAR000883 [Perkinsus marinus ATCC 50983]